jgi:CheY-like chemotaxis protein
MQLVTRTDAEQAWAYLQQNRPDLILLDVHLPGASGCDLCRRLRQAKDLSDVPVALLSQWRSEDVLLGLGAGVDFILAKDSLCRPEELRQRLEEIVVWIGGQHWNRVARPEQDAKGVRSAPDDMSRPSPPCSGRATLATLDGATTEIGRLVAHFNRTLRGPIAGTLEPEVLGALLARALERTETDETGPLAGDVRDWLSPDCLELDAGRVAEKMSAATLTAFIRRFAEQLWCMLGTAGSAPLREALASEPPAQPECPSPQ